MSKTVIVDERLRNALRTLHGERERRMSEALEQIALLTQLHDEYASAITEVNLADVVSRSPLLTIEWIPKSERGASLSVTCLDRRYAFGLEVHYELGGRIASTSKGGEEMSRDPGEFYRQVFRDTPVRLKLLEDGRIGIERRVGSNLPGIVLLSTFVEAVLMLERLRVS